MAKQKKKKLPNNIYRNVNNILNQRINRKYSPKILIFSFF